LLSLCHLNLGWVNDNIQTDMHGPQTGGFWRSWQGVTLKKLEERNQTRPIGDMK